MTRTRGLPRGVFHVASASQLRQLPPVLSSNRRPDLNSRLDDRSRSSGSTDGEAVEFSHFSKLPLELKTLIWEIACESEPQRVVSVYSQHIISYGRPNPNLYWTGVISTAPIPTALHTCSLSRQIALKYYKLCFGMTKGDDTVLPMIYFNYEKDMLLFREDRPINKYWYRSCFEQFFALVNSSDIERVRHLGFPSNLPVTMHYTAGSFHQHLRLWKALQTVCLGYDKYGFNARRAITFTPVENNDWTFAESCWNYRCRDSLLEDTVLDNLSRLNYSNYEELLQKAKILIEQGTTDNSGISGQEFGGIKPSFQAVFGTFQNI
ncbi:hypothetical protein ACMFMG_005337 [Clarireedia jacksonii]